jgi:hypothetical protein
MIIALPRTAQKLFGEVPGKKMWINSNIALQVRPLIPDIQVHWASTHISWVLNSLPASDIEVTLPVTTVWPMAKKAGPAASIIYHILFRKDFSSELFICGKMNSMSCIGYLPTALLPRGDGRTRIIEAPRGKPRGTFSSAEPVFNPYITPIVPANPAASSGECAGGIQLLSSINIFVFDHPMLKNIK